MAKDYCTGFFENWVQWKTFYRWEIFPLSELCKAHDEKCSTHTFFDLLKDNKVVGGWIIGTVATIGCWVKYPKDMKERL